MALGNNIGKPVTYVDRLTGKSVTVTPASAGGYMKAYSDYEARKNEDLTRKTEELDQRLQENNATTNSNYDNSARQAYVDYMRRQRALPSQLQALGVRGGATESGLLNLYNNYGVAHAANEQQRNADLTKNQQERDDTYDAFYDTWKTDLDNQYQTALNNQMNEYNNEVTRFSSSVAQYPSTKKGYENYQKWIKNLQDSKDPLKDIKVALVRQQMARQFPNGKPSGGGSGGGGGRGGRGYGGYGSSGGSGSSGGGSSYSDVGRSYADSLRKGASVGTGRVASRGSSRSGGSRTWRDVWGNRWSR